MSQGSKNALMAGLASIYDSTKYSDLTIRCRDRTFKVHRAVVCPRSAFFAAACDGCFKQEEQLFTEENMESLEAVAREITLPDDSPIIIEKMIGYLYKLDYSDSPLDCGGHPALLIDAQVYTIAEKYSIPSLKVLAREKFDGTVDKGWEDDGFSLAIKEIYTSTPDSDRGLRDIVCSAAEVHVKVLLSRPDFRALMLEVNEFTVDMLDAVVKVYVKK